MDWSFGRSRREAANHPNLSRLVDAGLSPSVNSSADGRRAQVDNRLLEHRYPWNRSRRSQPQRGATNVFYGHQVADDCGESKACRTAITARSRTSASPVPSCTPPVSGEEENPLPPLPCIPHLTSPRLALCFPGCFQSRDLGAFNSYLFNQTAQLS